MNEIDRHHLVYDRPAVYKCSCGFMEYLFPDGTMKIAEKPKGVIEYLPCGHAVCAKTSTFDCILCTMGHEIK